MRDFPRVPYPSGERLFRRLSGAGQKLINAHLKRHSREVSASDSQRVVGSVQSGYPKWENGGIFIGRGLKIASTTEDVWLFEIGAYQVCHKWLKDRRGRTLHSDDVAAYRHLLKTVEGTIRAMEEIDAIIADEGGWPFAE
jgi:hypothetical protein